MTELHPSLAELTRESKRLKAALYLVVILDAALLAAWVAYSDWARFLLK